MFAAASCHPRNLSGDLHTDLDNNARPQTLHNGLKPLYFRPFPSRSWSPAPWQREFMFSFVCT